MSASRPLNKQGGNERTSRPEVFPYVLFAVAAAGAVLGFIFGIIRRPASSGATAYIARTVLLGAGLAVMGFVLYIFLANLIVTASSMV